MAAIPPGSHIGILGGGQLGRMLAVAASRMGYHTHIYCPDEHSPAFEVATNHTCAAYNDEAALKKFAACVDVITYEFENIPTGPLAALGDKLKPSTNVLEVCQHRILEKETLKKLGIGTAPFVAVRNNQDLQEAIQTIGQPCVLKTATMGYDGKGQWMLKNDTPLPDIADGEYVLEGFVNFNMEISVIVARNEAGETLCYPPVHNIHTNHILSKTIAPAPISKELASKAEDMAQGIASGMELVGIMAVEMFVTANNDIVVNELAPRPHNSGHWSMDAAITCQFEQTIRAICGLPLGSTQRLCDATMLNLIGDEVHDWKKHINSANAKIHLYGKKEARPGRKMGHVTFLDSNEH